MAKKKATRKGVTPKPGRKTTTNPKGGSSRVKKARRDVGETKTQQLIEQVDDFDPKLERLGAAYKAAKDARVAASGEETNTKKAFMAALRETEQKRYHVRKVKRTFHIEPEGEKLVEEKPAKKKAKKKKKAA